MLRLITDCDGPMTDVSDRYFRVYQYCLEQVQQPGQPLTPLSKSEFWERKRAQIPEIEIGIISGLTPRQAEEFADLRHRTVHTMPFMPLDKLLPGVKTVLQQLKDHSVDLVVMTMRRERELAEAFERIGLSEFFAPDHRYCLGNDYQKTGDTNDKPMLMERAMAELPPAEKVWMVGDTEADIIAAQRVNIPVIAVLSGIRNHKQLQQHQPDAIVADLAAAATLFLQSEALETPTILTQPNV